MSSQQPGDGASMKKDLSSLSSKAKNQRPVAAKRGAGEDVVTPPTNANQAPNSGAQTAREYPSKHPQPHLEPKETSSRKNLNYVSSSITSGKLAAAGAAVTGPSERSLSSQSGARRSEYLKNKERRKVAQAVGNSITSVTEREPVDVEAGKSRHDAGDENVVVGASAISSGRQSYYHFEEEEPTRTAIPGAYRCGPGGQIQREDSLSEEEDDDDDELDFGASPSPSPGPSQEPPLVLNTAVSATVVDEEKIVKAESVSAGGFFETSKSRALSIIAVLLCLAIVLAVSLGVALSGDSSSKEAEDIKLGFASVMEPIDGARRSMFGSSVSLCNDGNRFAVAGPGNGLVQVFELDGEGGRVQVGQNFTYDTSVIGSSRHVKTGIVVDLSADCKVLAVGLPYHKDGDGLLKTGRVELYEYDSGLKSWEKLGVPHSISGENVGDFAGSSLSLSRDGGLVAIGSPGHDLNGEYSGQVRVFQLPQKDGSWAKLGSPLYGRVANESFGISVSLSSQQGSKVVAVGSTTPPGVDIAAASVYLFRTGEWIPRGAGIFPDPESLVGIETAWIVRLSPDGTKLVISNTYLGEEADGGTGVAVVADNRALYVAAYTFQTDDWIQLGGNLHTDVEGPKSGYTVSLSEDGTRIGMGDAGVGEAGQGGGFSGHAHIYEFNDGRWCQLGENIVGYAAGDLAGFDISLSGDGNRILVGSPLNRAQGSERGRVWLKDVTDDAMITWCEE